MRSKSSKIMRINDFGELSTMRILHANVVIIYILYSIQALKVTNWYIIWLNLFFRF